MRYSHAGAITAAIGALAIVAFTNRWPVVATPLSPKESGPPKPLAYEHFIRLKIMKITPVEQTDRFRLLELKVQRFYGKIEVKSLERNREYETQEFTILLPVAADAVVNVGDIIDYEAVRYLSPGSD